MDMQLKDKVAVITDGISCTGEVVAKALAQEGNLRLNGIFRR